MKIRLKWFGHVKRIYVDYVVKSILDQRQVNQITRGREKSKKKTIKENIKKDLKVNKFDKVMHMIGFSLGYC